MSTPPSSPAANQQQASAPHKPARSNTRAIFVNTLANWSYQGWNTLIVLILTPYLIHQLGDGRYGLYSIARDSHLYLTIFSLGLRSGVNRFIAAEITRRDSAALNAIVSTLSAIYFVTAAAGFLLAIGLGFASPWLFDISQPFVVETVLLFVLFGAMLLFEFQAMTFVGVLVGHQRFELVNLGLITQETIRFALIILLFTLGFANLTSLGVALLASAACGMLMLRFFARRVQSDLRIAPFRAERAVLGRLLGFSAWNSVVQIGTVATFATPALLIGALLGKELVVFFAVPFMIWNRLRALIGGLANTLAPIAAQTLVTEDRALFGRLIVKGCRVAALLALPLGAIFAVLAEPFFIVWLGVDYAQCATVFAVLFVGMAGRITQIPAQHVLIGGGRIEGMAYVQGVAAVLTIVLIALVATLTDYGVLGVCWALTVPFILSHSVCIPWLAARQAGMSTIAYFSQIYAGPIVCAGVGAAVAAGLAWLYAPSGYALLALYGALALGASAAAGWQFALEPAQRAAIRARLLRRPAAT